MIFKLKSNFQKKFLVLENCEHLKKLKKEKAKKSIVMKKYF
jgi:hypothetical protein